MCYVVARAYSLEQQNAGRAQASFAMHLVSNGKQCLYCLNVLQLAVTSDSIVLIIVLVWNYVDLNTFNERIMTHLGPA